MHMLDVSAVGANRLKESALLAWVDGRSGDRRSEGAGRVPHGLGDEGAIGHGGRGFSFTGVDQSADGVTARH